MKPGIAKLTAFVLFLASIFSGCSKDDIFQNPIPGKPGKPADTGVFRFAVALDLAGQPYHSSNLTAVASIVNDKNVEVATEKLLTLDLTGGVKSEHLKLPAGTYKLTRFRLVYGAVNTHFAAPVAGSAKAALVQKPLALSFNVTAGTSADVPVEVVKVQAGERPGAFGYPSGAFDNGQSDADPYMKIKIATSRQVGKIMYDSVPASLALTTWDNNGERSLAFISLKAGITEVPLLKSGVRFQLEVSRWGVINKMTLERAEVNEDTVYAFSGAREAKLLKSETTYRLVDGQYKAESKNAYTYDAAGNLSQIHYYQKRNDNTPFLAMKDVFEYSGANVQKITRYDKADKVMGITSFGYDAQGRVRNMAQNENGMKTTATVEYMTSPFQATSIHYEYPGQNHTMGYYMTFEKGNVVRDNVLITGHSNEEGMYNHDTEINPYAHMNWPNLYLSNSSKNNVIAQYKTYYGNHPAAIPYSFTYSYDVDGYPKELVKQLQPYGENHHWYTTKTVYTY